MSWYYSSGNEKVGPVELTEIASLISSGTITNDTLLWKDGMPDWKPYRELRLSPELFEDSDFAICAESGNLTSKENMVRFGNVYVAAEYKDAYMQKIQEGAADTSGNEFTYGGFWIRFVAKFVDWILVAIPYYAILFILMFATGFGAMAVDAADPNSDPGAAAMFGFIYLILVYGVYFGVGSVYNLIFLPKFGATPGKMACGLKVVNPDGSYVSKGKAVGRFFAEFINAFTLTIGYIMAAFDDEKRSLHDRICNTRVVNK